MPRRIPDEALRTALKEVLAQRKEKNPAYSLRAFARQLSVSPSFLCEVQSGRKGLSRQRAELLRQKLGLPTSSATAAGQSVLVSPVGNAIESGTGSET